MGRSKKYTKQSKSIILGLPKHVKSSELYTPWYRLRLNCFPASATENVVNALETVSLDVGMWVTWPLDRQTDRQVGWRENLAVPWETLGIRQTAKHLSYKNTDHQAGDHNNTILEHTKLMPDLVTTSNNLGKYRLYGIHEFSALKCKCNSKSHGKMR